jgi:tRNA (uracil-5-)-methyltransferase TRM9
MNQEKVWDKIAGLWKNYRYRISPSVEKFLSGKKGKILDIGCGSGRNIKEIKGVEWYGVDFSKEMLKFAESLMEKKGLSVNLKKSNAEGLPFEDNYFDSILSVAVLHCIDSIDKRKTAIKEIYRVLKPGSEAFISSWGSKSPRLKNKGKECYIPWTVREEGEKIKRYTYVYDLDELVELCRSVGFEIISSWEERNVNVIVRKN